MKREDVNVYGRRLCVYTARRLLSLKDERGNNERKKKTFTGQDDHSFVEAQLEKRS